MHRYVIIFIVLSILYCLAVCTLLRRQNDEKQCYDDECRDDIELVKYVKEIKNDCASLCETSEKAEQQFHRGSIYLSNSLIYT